ncbi:VWA domain-containing protein [Marinobacter sp. F4206]|uniref:VWA domain-containing protein n=1 Tax=Marinobacter sp. F4206 TaxID=2861777 RepID=UPI001C5D209C|nr:VWA domain-containing protein [Marinobacter sp. F4206]MBW4935553.1 VWA domain-containing protein [Marinobacter sp. F4206]
MSDLAVLASAFHFIRPWLLVLVPMILIVWWFVRRSEKKPERPGREIAEHLRSALTVGSQKGRRLRPIDGAAVALILLNVGAAGPTWSRTPEPFSASTSPAIVVLAVTESMAQADVPPSRLDRAKQKVRDLLDLRAGAQTALLAYAGTAHLVVPMTEDPSVMVPYLAGLSPDVMPEQGSRLALAWNLALELMTEQNIDGSILLVTDDVDPADAEQINGSQDAERTVLLSVLPNDTTSNLDNLNVSRVELTPDKSDVAEVDQQLTAAYRKTLLQNTDQPWLDQGHWFAWPAALILLLGCRRGWTMKWGAMAAALSLMPVSHEVRAEGIRDWFFTLDQQGRTAFEDKDFGLAAKRFVDPLWRGYALYRDGQYVEAIPVLERLDSPDAAFIQGMAYIKSRGYRDGVRAFEAALERDPEYPGARENLELARQIVDYVEQAREDADTGEENLGADDVVFDNEASRGSETQMEAANAGGEALLSTDQWMNTVDTQTADFLRQRFAIEAASGRGREAEDSP